MFFPRSTRPPAVALAACSATTILLWALSAAAFAAPNTSPPAAVARLVFIHHSTGSAWLQDGYGNLASALGANNYYVSDTNYGWGPSVIGDSTDIGHWWTWFRGPSAPTFMSALYANTGINAGYARSLANPGGENTVIMFKSCFPNSAVGGSVGDAIPVIGSNPLRGNSGPLTVGNAKGIYLDLLEYFQARPDKLFVLIVSPPLRSAETNPSQAANARYLANWLTDSDGYLNGYSAGNVFVFDYYTVLTGGHHRIVGGAVEHSAGATNYLAFETGDSHPSAAGDQLATSEFVPMLNAAYNAWKAQAVPVYRFLNPQTGFYLWSADPAERASINATLRNTWREEGVSYRINPATNSSPMWRFRNLRNGAYLWSADPAERATINANLSATWKEEGESYRISRTGGTPVYRFLNLRNGSYLWSADPAERATINATLRGTWREEGVSYFLAP